MRRVVVVALLWGCAPNPPELPRPISEAPEAGLERPVGPVGPYPRKVSITDDETAIPSLYKLADGRDRIGRIFAQLDDLHQLEDFLERRRRHINRLLRARSDGNEDEDARTREMSERDQPPLYPRISASIPSSPSHLPTTAAAHESL